jgi:predicted AlkP superfamily pyrophosphatase or phosphodiesterase
MASRLCITRRALALFLLCGALPAQVAAPAPRPKLVLGIVIDQFRYDYLTRFRADYNSGIARLLRQGAVFTNARYEHYPTVTAIGHAVFLTGAPPSLSGIVGNEWFDRQAGREVSSVEDPATQLLGAPGEGSSPRNLLVSTVGDEMKTAWRGQPRVIGISLKDRAAILPAGHTADAAYWFDARAGLAVSSTYYFKDLPQWVQDFNRDNPPTRYLNAEWKPLVPSPDYPAFSHRLPAEAGRGFYRAIATSPFGNEATEALAERALDAERLGRRNTTDLLTVSFSSNDYVGHKYGPDSPEVRDMAIRADRLIGRLLDFVDKKVGPGNTLVVFTSDHGVAPLPEAQSERHMPGGRLPPKVIRAAIVNALNDAYGQGNWIESTAGGAGYFNRSLIQAKKLREAEVERIAARAAAAVPHVYRVYTRTQLLAGAEPSDAVSQRVSNGFYPARSGDLFVLYDPYWISAAEDASHGSVFDYDTHVPVIFLGPGVKRGMYDQNISPNDIAPTLATMLQIATPSGSTGRVLTEMLSAAH